ncbi:MAG: hypothetical protein V3U72_02690, partial [Candidatus Aenigmarchaeota archaeon]
EGVSCIASGPTGTSYDRDTSQSRCESTDTNCTAYYWDIGGEVDPDECCEDDLGENNLYRIANSSMDNNWATNTSDDACCDAANDCVALDACYNSGNVSNDMDGDGDNDYCNAGTWYDCETNIQCPAGYDCYQGECLETINITYVLPTPEHNSRQANNSVTVNVTVNDTIGKGIDTCWLEWNGVNETMNMAGSGTFVTCYLTKPTTDGLNYTFRAHANDTAGYVRAEDERNFTEDSRPTMTAVYLNVSFAKNGEHVLVSTTGANDMEGDSYYLRCGNVTGGENLCNSTQGTGERSCSFSSGWGDDSNHTIYCHLDDTYKDSNEREVNLTADNTPPTPEPAQILSVVMTSNSSTITAVEASDSGAGLHSTPYRFNDSGVWKDWQAGRVYVNNSLTPNTQYCFRVQYKDSLGNTGSVSQEFCNRTLPEMPGITSVVCSYNGTHNCEVNFTVGSNPLGTEYYINETTGNAGGDDKNWTAWAGENSYVDTVSLPHTQYCYKAKVRDENGTESLYSSQLCNTTYNHLPYVYEPKTYDIERGGRDRIEAGREMYIRVNITDADGISDLSSAKIRITDNKSVVRVNNADMSNISAITNGYTYQYNYRTPSDGEGIWTVEITGIDVVDGEGTNSITFVIAVLELNVRLVLNETSAKTYVPAEASGEEEKTLTNLEYEYYPTTDNYYLTSYYNRSLYGLVFQGQNLIGTLTDKTSNTFTLGMDLKHPNSVVFLVFSKGDWRDVENRINLIKSEEFLDYSEPSFSFGLGDTYRMKVFLEYEDMDVLGGDSSIGTGEHPLSIKHGGMAGEDIRLNITRK